MPCWRNTDFKIQRRDLIASTLGSGCKSSREPA